METARFSAVLRIENVNSGFRPSFPSYHDVSELTIEVFSASLLGIAARTILLRVLLGGGVSFSVLCDCPWLGNHSPGMEGRRLFVGFEGNAGFIGKS